jgi:TolB protein
MMTKKWKFVSVAMIAVSFSIMTGYLNAYADDAEARVRSGKILFAAKVGAKGKFQICTMRPDGSGIVRLTNTNSNNGEARFSPDGKSIIFTRNDSQLMIMSNNGKNQRKLYQRSSSDYLYGSFAQRGKSFVFSGGSDIREINLKTGVVKDLITPDIYIGVNSYPDWTDVGKRMVFTRKFIFSSPFVRNLIAVPRANLDNTMELTHYSDLDEGYANGARWSPSGKQIAYHCTNADTTDYEIYIMNGSGGKKTRLTRGPAFGSGNNIFPVWSPDGKSLAFASGPPERRNIFIMDIRTRKTRQVTFDQYSYACDWK